MDKKRSRECRTRAQIDEKKRFLSEEINIGAGRPHSRARQLKKFVIWETSTSVSPSHLRTAFWNFLQCVFNDWSLTMKMTWKR